MVREEDAIELAHERRGSGDPLVLIHGLGGSRRIWDPVLDRLAAEREVVAVDLPGFGGSPELADGVPPSAANLGAAVSAFCERLGLDRPHLAGNSLGGWVALEIAKAQGAASVCCLSPAGLWRRPLGPRRYDARRLGHRLRPLLPLLLASRRARRALLQTTLAHPERLTAAEARGLVSDWLTAPGYDAANEQMRAHVFEDPERVTVPSTISWGDADRLLAPPRPERMPPGSRYLVLEGCGHTPTWDDPEAVTRLLLEASSAEPGAVRALAGT
jgi:pimeloyl-ACP methyl ester carboxylesterase